MAGVAPPFTQCPSVNLASSCDILIVITDAGTSVLVDPAQPAYDVNEGDDALVGVQNNSTKTVRSLPLSSTADIFKFDGDGLCTFLQCAYGPTGYEGPGITFTNLSPDGLSGTVNFTNGLAPGGATFFALENALQPTGTPVKIPDLQLLPQPQRVADTRIGGGPITAGSSRCFPVAGVGGVAADASAVLLNVTAVNQTRDGWLTVFPSGQAVPPTSTVNFGTAEYAVANNTIMRLGSGGQVCVNVGTVNAVPGSSHVVLDVTGYLSSAAPADMPMLAAPVRLADTRTSGGVLASGSSRCFQVAGLGGIPADAAAVVLNVTAVNQTRDGWLAVFPSGQAVPPTSTVNFGTAEYAVANNTIMRLGSGGQVCVNVGTVNAVPGSSHVVLDATGYLTQTALAQLPMLAAPQRLVDTRISPGPIVGGDSRCFTLAGVQGVPANAIGVVLNVTTVGYAVNGWATTFPAGQSVPATSTVNFDVSEYAMANGAIMALGTNGQLCVQVGTVNSVPGISQVVLDVVGYLAP